jgi:hypothetical protein
MKDSSVHISPFTNHMAPRGSYKDPPEDRQVKFVSYSNRKKALEKSKSIDHLLKKETLKLSQEKCYKMLLLGSSDSGKTTILKQFKVLYSKGFTHYEKTFFKRKVVDNSVDTITLLVQALSTYQIPIHNSENQKYVDLVSGGTPRDANGCLYPESIQAIAELWKDESIQKVYLKGNEFGLQDTADYFLSNITRIGNPNYEPIDDDILRAKYRTSEISENQFDIGGAQFSIYDVGGHRKLRLFCT